MKHEYNITPEFFRLIKIGDKNFLLIPEANYEIGDRIAIYEKVNAKDTLWLVEDSNVLLII